jgi:uncharacterized protein (DUF2147 family)
MGFLIAAVLIPGSQSFAASANPTGVWRKAQQGERPGKFEIFWCGRSKKLLCAKIVWLQDPNDSQGRPLHDVRNENPSMRDRPIMGLPIFSGLQPVAPATWKGSIYNPEDGNTYSVTLTQLSRDQINIKGCKAWLLCGERTWLRTTLPKPEPEAEPQIEASAQPGDAAVQPANAEASPPPSAKVANESQAKMPSSHEPALANAEMLTPTTPPSGEDTHQGYRFLDASAATVTPAGFSGGSVPSMFAMTTPLASDAVPSEDSGSASIAAQSPRATQQAAAQPGPPVPQAKPKSAPAPIEASAAATSPKQSVHQQGDTSDAVAEADTGTAETAVIDEPPLTRRQRRLLRRQYMREHGEQPFLPWLR